ncbi:hypothetical protein [Labilibaculum sp.]|uniref:hypothetical protein n=1 Tax=Labilibaculum sp. TaxID=2060723 RepID=UPI002AA6325C|nr:hypothetical protein [Labilibaculum sp.]
MKNRFGIVILIAFFLFGCKTTKVNTKIDRDVQTEEKRDVKETIDGTVTVIVNEVVETQNDVEENSVVTEVVRELSKPDTSGQQYTTRITERTITRDKTDKTQTQSARDSSSNTDVQAELTDNTNLKSDGSEKIDSKSKIKVKTPGIINWVIILLVLGVLVFGYFILRRYKLIK